MNYIEYKIEFSKDYSHDSGEIAMAELADLGFDSFEDNEAVLLSYITEENQAIYKEQIDEYVDSLRLAGHMVTVQEIETINWNEEWESNFEPIDIDDVCRIRAPFHEKNENCKHDLIIMPKMSFGTGHHATTHLMTKTIFSLDIEGKDGLDMGSGTGVLAIAALKAGAKEMTCVDVDEWAYDNCIENCQTNGLEDRCKIIHGDAGSIYGDRYDFILANINRNILINDMPLYVETLSEGGYIAMSGFLEIDLDDIKSKAAELNLSFVRNEVKDGWVVALFVKND